MKKLLKTYFLSFLSLGFILVACNKEEEEEPTVNATLQLSSPNEGDTLHYLDTLKISGTLSADGAMHGYKLSLSRVSNDSLLFTSSVDEHLNSFMISKSWINYMNVSDQLRLKIEALTGHDGQTQVFQKLLVLAP